MSIETFEHRGAVITLGYDELAPCPIGGAGSWAEGVGIVRNERGSIEVARVYAMWAEGAVYHVHVVLPDGEAEGVGGVYFDSPYPDRDEVVSYVEGCLCTWDDPAEDESESEATGGAVVSVKVSDAVKNLGGAGFSAGEVEVILGALGSGV